ncbi:hypothetical protein Dimus_009077 [Dionaea muscipula]
MAEGTEGHEIPNHVHEVGEPKLNGSRKLTKNPSLATLVSVLLGVDKNRQRQAVTMVLFLIDEDDVRSPPPSWRDGGDGRRKKRQMRMA